MANYTASFNAAGATSTGTQLSDVIRTVYSAEMLYTAQPILRFDAIVTEKTELSASPGSTIQFTKYDPLTGSSTLTEGGTVSTDALGTSTITVTVAEYGKAVSVTEMLMRTAFTDVMRDASTLLGRHYAKDYNSRVRDVLNGSSNVIYANDRADRSALTATDTFSVGLIREVVEELATNKVPKFGGDAYICYVHPHQAVQLRNDPEWTAITQYANAGNFLNGEIGRLEDVRFIETTLCLKVDTSGNIYSDGTDTTSDESTFNSSLDTYKAFICGDHVVGHAQALPVEMRDNGIEDFGRKRSLMWYTIDGFGLIESGHAYTVETV